MTSRTATSDVVRYVNEANRIFREARLDAYLGREQPRLRGVAPMRRRDATPAQRDAVRAATKVRAELVRTKRNGILLGECGWASTLLAIELGDAAVLRTGFFFVQQTLLGKRGRYPNEHAWNVVDGLIIDITATQFGRFRAVHIEDRADSIRYREDTSGWNAVNEIASWGYRQYPRLARRLRHAEMLRAASSTPDPG